MHGSSDSNATTGCLQWYRQIVVAIIMPLALLGRAEATGFRTLKGGGVTIGVWYPADALPTPGRLGPFDVEYAFDAAPTPGRWDPILLSHGVTGRFRNHHLTATALSNAGFIVIAPQHRADHYIGTGKTAAATGLRIKELHVALEAVADDPALGPVMDMDRVHALGYSLGGATVLAAAGAGVDLGRAESHCNSHGDVDEEFCGFPDTTLRLRQFWERMSNPVPMEEMPNVYRVDPYVNGRVAVIAPVGQILEPRLHDVIATQTLVVAIKGDRIAQPRFHARMIADGLPRDRFSGLVEMTGHHYAFIAPFPKWLTDRESIPVAKDPDGFDRVAFIDKINEILVTFYLNDDVR